MIRSRIAALGLTVALLPGPLAAQRGPDPGDTTVRDSTSEPVAQITAEALDIRSPSASRNLSLWTTVGSLAVGAAFIASGTQTPIGGLGLVFGPATGYWSGGVSGRGWGGVALRSGISVGGALLAVAVCGTDSFGCENEDAALAVLIATGAAMLGSAIHDISTVDDRVRERNERLRAESERPPAVMFAPVISPADGGTVGLTARLGF